MMLTAHAENILVDAILRGVTPTFPTSLYFALFQITAVNASSNIVPSPRSSAVTVGQTTVPFAFGGAGPNQMFRCTTAGTTSGSEPTWNAAEGGTTTDGTVVWTEMTPDFRNNTTAHMIEVPSSNNYSRPGLVSSVTNWSATNGATTVTNPSSGSSGTSSNNVAIPWPTPSSPGWGTVAMIMTYDAATAGSPWFWGPTPAANAVTGPSTPPSLPVSSAVFRIDN
jgi:hypothetical protein